MELLLKFHVSFKTYGMYNSESLSFFSSDNKAQKTDMLLTLQEGRRSGRQLKATNDLSKMSSLDSKAEALLNWKTVLFLLSIFLVCTDVL